jgi:hypothetical protein
VVGAFWCAHCEIRVDLASSLTTPPTAPGEAVFEEALTSIADAALGPLGFLVSGPLAIRNNRVRDEWMLQVQASFASVGRLFNPDDPLLIAIFNKLTVGALQTDRTDKRQMMADALTNVSSFGPNPDAFQDLLADLVLQYSPEHLLYLEMLEEQDIWLWRRFEKTAGGLYVGEVFREIFAGAKHWNVLGNRIMKQVFNDNLVSAFPSKAVDTPCDETFRDVVLWDLGRALLDFVKQRPADTGHQGPQSSDQWGGSRPGS